MWENIRNRYSVPTVPRIHQLKAQIASCKQEGQEVVEFYSKLMTLWNELDKNTKNPTCTCAVAKKIGKIMDEDRVHQLLMGLNDDLCGTVRSQILAFDPLLHLDKKFNMVQQEENHKSVMINRGQKYEPAIAFCCYTTKEYLSRVSNKKDRA